MLKHASEELWGDREFVLAAVANNGYALQYASEELWADREVVLAAVANNGLALRFASEELRADREFVLAAVAMNVDKLVHWVNDDWWLDREFVLRVVERSGSCLEYVRGDLRFDREVISRAVAADNLEFP